MQFITLTADITLDLGKAPRNTSVLLVLTGGFGGGSVLFGTRNASSAFAEFSEPAAITAKGNTTIFLGKGTTLVVNLASSTTPTLEIGIAGDFFEFDSGIYLFT